MNGYWSFQLDGRKHTVTVDITTGFPLSRLRVTLDGERIYHDSIVFFLGTLHTFHRLGHHFRVRIWHAGEVQTGLGRNLLRTVTDRKSVTVRSMTYYGP